MVLLQLSIKAELENVTSLVPADDNFEYFFEVKCNSCNETHQKLISMNRLEEREIPHSKGSTAHFVWKCPMCKRESSAKFAPTPPRPYEADGSGQFAPLIQIECRGLEFTNFDPRGTWKCKGVGKRETQFSDIVFEDNEWVDYDESAAQPVGISWIGSEFARA